MRQPRLGRHPLGLPFALLLVAFLAGALAAPEALARVKKVAFVDDDWDPIERGPGDQDPHYEDFFLELFDSLDYTVDVFEVQPDAGDPHVPTIEQLTEYPYVIWNCASADRIALSYAERRLLREYRARGGKLMLLGQGILNALGTPPFAPDVQDFLRFELGIESFAIDAHVVGMEPSDALGYAEEIGFVDLDTANLPDPDPTLGDVVYPTAGTSSHLTGTLDAGGTAPISTNRYLPAPLHFQSVLMEAVADTELRAAYLSGYSEWLGFEGDDLMDFMDGLEDLTPGAPCPPHELDWDPELRAIRFASWGSASCDAVLSMPLLLTEGECADWSIRFSHLISNPGAQSEMVLLELAGGADLLRVLALPSAAGGETFDLRFKVLRDGQLVHDERFPDLALETIRRLRVSQSFATPMLGIEISDSRGNFIAGSTFTDFVLEVEELRLRARGLNHEDAQPVEGWIDDLAIGGCLVPRLTTAVGEAPPLLLGSLRVQPNPFNPSTRISGELVVAGRVELAVYDAQGRRQRLLDAGERAAGPFSVEWDGRDEAGRRLPGGVYLVRLSDGTGSRAVKLVMLK
jgi:hypothetical protein